MPLPRRRDVRRDEALLLPSLHASRAETAQEAERCPRGELRRQGRVHEVWRSESEEGKVYCENGSGAAFAAAAVDEGAAGGGGGVVGF